MGQALRVKPSKLKLGYVEGKCFPIAPAQKPPGQPRRMKYEGPLSRRSSLCLVRGDELFQPSSTGITEPSTRKKAPPIRKGKVMERKTAWDRRDLLCAEKNEGR